jgi:hypothetical protein
MEPNDARKTRNRNRRPVWPFIAAAALLVIVLVLVGRSCRPDYGDVPPMISDTLDTDRMDPADTALNDPGDPNGANDPNGMTPRPDTALTDPEIMTPAIAPSSGPASPGGCPSLEAGDVAFASCASIVRHSGPGEGRGRDDEVCSSALKA